MSLPDDPSRADGIRPAHPPRDEERRLVLETWNRTATPYPTDAGIPALFEAQAARTPDAVAVVHEDTALSYAELNARANRLAHQLIRLGLGTEARVGVCLERGPEMIVALLAVLKAGGAYVPLDPAYPPARLAWMMADAGIRALIARGGAPAGVAVPGGVARVDPYARGDEAEGDAENPARGTGPGSLAYVIYTSGSTGVPKGVAVEHRGVVRLVRGADYADFGPEQVILQDAPLSFDASTLEIWSALLNGARLVLLPAGRPSLEDIGRTLVRHGVTTLWTTAGLFHALVQERLDDLRGVRQLLAGGDVLPPAQVALVRRRFPGLRLINGYGPTENTTLTTAFTVPAAWDGSPVPIGRPIANTRVYVLDDALHPVPIGAAGELYTGGAGLARGYLGRPALTAERFVPNPFGGEPGARLYRTGDRARWRPDGTLDFLGRVDGQVKIRGFRIEPGEVEAALVRHPGVTACAVVAREDVPGDRRLVAYVVGAAGADDLRDHARRALPEHMVPAAFVPLAQLPLTANGKIDRGALPAPEYGAADGDGVPRGEVEQRLARIWGEVLGLRSVPADQPFYALGGHSLAGMRILARIADAFGVRVSAGELLRSGRIREVAALIAGAGRAAEPVPPPARVPRDASIPLSFAQEGAWFFERLAPGLGAYRSQAVIHLHGPLDVPALERALEEIIRRHEIYRTTFSVHDGTPSQHVHAPWPVRLPVHDAADEDAAEAMARDAFARPFDATVLPLVRWTLIRTAPDAHRLAMVEHHFVHDGWSFGIFLRELRALYLAYVDGAVSPLAPPGVQFADYTAWQRAWMETEAAQARLRDWEQALAGVPPLVLPTDHPRPPAMRFRGAAERVRLDPALAAEARAFSRAQGVTFFVTLLAAFQAVLGRWSGQRDFCVGSGLGNRGQVWLEDVIGMIVNTVAFRADLAGDPTGRELLRRVHDDTLRAYERQDVPFDQVVRRIRPERTSSALPIYQVAFSAHDSPMADLAWGPLRLELQEAQNNGSTKADLNIVVIPRAEQGVSGEDEVMMVWEYDADLFAPATIRRLVGHFRTLLADLVAHPDRPLSALRMMDDDERRLVVDEWNRTGAPVPADGRVHGPIEAQAARTPDAVALVHETARISYGAVNARANRLAHHLRRLGVGPEVRVGVCLDRGPELLVALLAVLKAGGAYVPLDPAYPAERLAWTLADAGAPVLVTRDALRGLLPARDGLRVVRVDGDAAAIAAEPAENPDSGVTPRNLAYLIYTSGSTGLPKGIAVEHRGAAAMLAWACDRLPAEDLAATLASISICFDISVVEFFAPLMRGGHLVLIDNPLALARCPARDEVRLMNAVPSALAALLRAGALPSGLRTVNLGGEAVKPELVDALYARGVQRVHDIYGPSEYTTLSTCGLRRPGGPATIGRPIDNTRCYVLDDALRPVPIGVDGELFVGGRGETRGYLGRPALTAERYLPDAFSGLPGARLYRTGDRARWRDDGTLEYRGRLDHQAKIRGYRVEPGEVESALRACDGVRDCVVVVREEAPGDARLVAYVAGDAGVDALRARLRERMPEYMVPSAFVVLDALPLMPNGKVDRAALPAPAHAAAEFAPPETPAERMLAGIWAAVLRVERVGVNENFFELGGHSLLLMDLQGRLETALGREVTVAELFRHPTVRSFHASLSAADARPAAARRGEDRGHARRAALSAAPRRGSPPAHAAPTAAAQTPAALDSAALDSGAVKPGAALMS